MLGAEELVAVAEKARAELQQGAIVKLFQI